MKTLIKPYVDNLFLKVRPSQAVDALRLEMVHDMEERYDECVAGGMTPQKAYIAVIDTLGNVDGMIEQVSASDSYDLGFFEKESPKSLLYGKYSYVFKPRNLKVIKRAAIAVMWLIDFGLMFSLQEIFHFDGAFNLIFVGLILHMIMSAVGDVIIMTRQGFDINGCDPKRPIKIIKRLRRGATGVLWTSMMLAYSLLDDMFRVGSDAMGALLIFTAALQVVLSTVAKLQINRFRPDVKGNGYGRSDKGFYR